MEIEFYNKTDMITVICNHANLVAQSELKCLQDNCTFVEAKQLEGLAEEILYYNNPNADSAMLQCVNIPSYLLMVLNIGWSYEIAGTKWYALTNSNMEEIGWYIDQFIEAEELNPTSEEEEECR